MIAYIWFDLKRKIKNPKTLFVIVLIMILSFQKIAIYNTEYNKSNNNKLYSKAGTIESIGKSGPDFYSRENRDLLNEGIIYSYKLIEDIGLGMRKAIRNNDYKEYNRLSTFGKLIISKRIILGENKIRQMSFKKQSIHMWNHVSNGISYDDIYFEELGRGQLPFYYVFLLNAKHDYSLYREGLNPMDLYQLDSITFLYMYLNEVLPLIIGFIILILTFDSINEEWNKGSLKLTLANIFSRRKYIVYKIIIGTLYTTFTVTIPAIIISLGYGLFDGFVNLKYPVLYLKQGFQTLKSLPNYIEFDMGNVGYNGEMGISMYSGIPKGEMGLSNRLTLIPLYESLLLASIILLLSIIFYVVLNTLISSIVKDKIMGFVISIIITILGIVISQPLTMNKNYNISPFTMNNPIRILAGTYNTTALASLLILVGVSTLLILFNLAYFKNKDL